MRFTLRTLMLMILGIAFLGAVCFAFPVWLANLVMAPLFFAVPAVFTVGLIYGPRPCKPFFVGALSPFVGQFVLRHETISDVLAAYSQIARHLYARIGQNDRTDPFGNDVYLDVVTFAIFSLIAGVLCQGVWRLCWKDHGHEET